jgi:hypothetical protein
MSTPQIRIFPCQKEEFPSLDLLAMDRFNGTALDRFNGTALNSLQPVRLFPERVNRTAEKLPPTFEPVALPGPVFHSESHNPQSRPPHPEAPTCLWLRCLPEREKTIPASATPIPRLPIIPVSPRLKEERFPAHSPHPVPFVTARLLQYPSPMPTPTRRRSRPRLSATNSTTHLKTTENSPAHPPPILSTFG